MAEGGDGGPGAGAAAVGRIPKKLFDAAVVAALLAFVLAVSIVFVSWAFNLPIQLGTFGTVGRGTAVPSNLDRASFPSNAVIAFDSECPMGWVRFEPAASRVIVGASKTGELANGPSKFRHGSNGDELNARPLGSHGGTEQVTLFPEQIPSHRHATPIHQAVGDQRGFGREPVDQNIVSLAVPTQDRKDDGAFGTDFAGKGEPHFNMPPYVALYYCIQE